MLTRRKFLTLVCAAGVLGFGAGLTFSPSQTALAGNYPSSVSYNCPNSENYINLTVPQPPQSCWLTGGCKLEIEVTVCPNCTEPNSIGVYSGSIVPVVELSNLGNRLWRYTSGCDASPFNAGADITLVLQGGNCGVQAAHVAWVGCTG